MRLAGGHVCLFFRESLGLSFWVPETSLSDTHWKIILLPLVFILWTIADHSSSTCQVGVVPASLC